MATLETLRKLRLSFPETTEGPHFEKLLLGLRRESLLPMTTIAKQLV